MCSLAFAFATIGNRRQPFPLISLWPCPVPLASAAKVVILGRSLISCGGTVWHSILFQNSQRVKGCSVWQAQYFCIVFRRREDFHFSWQAQHCRCMVLCVFAKRIVGLRQVVTTCKLCCRRGIVRVSFCVAGAAFGADPSCVECHFAWQAQYLGHSTPFTLFTIFTIFAVFALHLTLHTLRFTVDTWGHGRAAQDFDLVRYTEPEAAFVCRSVLAALSHLHALPIVHRDIKPGNVLVGNGGERILLGAGCIGCDCSNRSHHWWESSQMVNSFIILSLQKNNQF